MLFLWFVLLLQHLKTDAMRQILFSILILSLLITFSYLLLVREFTLATRMSMAQRDACETDKTLNGQVNEYY